MGTPIGCGLYREQSENGPILTQNGTFWTQNGDAHPKDTPRVSNGGGTVSKWTHIDPKWDFLDPKWGAPARVHPQPLVCVGKRQKTPPKLHFLDPKWGSQTMGTLPGSHMGGEVSVNGPILTQNWTFWTQNGEPRHEYTRSHWSAWGNGRKHPQNCTFWTQNGDPKPWGHSQGLIWGEKCQ